VESGAATVVGVNRFPEGDEGRPPVLRVDETLQGRRAERLAAIKARRDREEVDAALRRVHEAAGSEQNLLPPILEAVEAEATLGEIADRLRAVFGIHQEAFAF